MGRDRIWLLQLQCPEPLNGVGDMESWSFYCMGVAFPTQLCSLTHTVVWLLSLAGCGSCPAAFRLL